MSLLIDSASRRLGRIALPLALVVVTLWTASCGNESPETKAQTPASGSNKRAAPKIAKPKLPAPRFDPKKLVLASAGTASIDLVKHPYETPAGFYSVGRHDDYVLRNGRVVLIFAKVERKPEGAPGDPRRVHQGALLDVMVDDKRVDFIHEFTQGEGTDSDSPIIDYDYAEFVKSGTAPGQDGEPGNSVGLKLSGPLPEGGARVETVYWLAPDETRVKVISKLIGSDAPPIISDVGNWGAGSVLSEKHGSAPMEPAPLSGPRWYAATAGKMAIGVSNIPLTLSGTAKWNVTRLAPDASAMGKNKTLQRWIYMGAKGLSSVTDQIFTNTSPTEPYGWFRGVLREKDSKQPTSEGFVNILWYQANATGNSEGADLKLFTSILPDANGNFQAVLPLTYTNPDTKETTGRFAIATSSRSRNFGPSQQGIVIKTGAVYERDVYVSEPGKLKISIIDAETKKPIAGRVRIDPIAPTPKYLFDEISSARGFYDSFYVPPGGTEVELFQGRWSFTVSSGIHYDFEKKDLDIAWGGETSAEFSLKQSSPTPGWLGMEIGAMTRATAGCALADEDIVLMAAGEGLDWIVSGDWETITDLKPAVEKLGLKNFMGVSRGFRTYLPAHPEWGPFFVFPVAENAPDPAQARDQWKNLETAKEFVAALRKLYPGSIIESINPYSNDDGYFYRPGKNVFEMAYDAREDIELSIDAVNVFEPRTSWDFSMTKNFYLKNTLRSRFYIPAPVSTSRIALSGEPGYPRMLVRTGESDPTKVTEAALFDAMRKGRWQVTTGPFIDYSVEGVREGDMIKGKEKLKAHLVITAPVWSSTQLIDVCREGLMNSRLVSNLAATDSVRWPNPGHPAELDIELQTQGKGGSDTMLNIMVTGSGPAEPVVPTLEGRPGTPQMAMSAPIIADTNSNGVWDPPSYRDQGK